MRTSLLVVLPLAAGLHGIAMNFSAEKASRKWHCSGLACGERPMVAVAAVLLMLFAPTEPAAAAQRPGAWSQGPWGDPFRERRPTRRAALPASVPLPKSRPPEAPAAEPEKPAAAKQAPAEPHKPAVQPAPAPPPPSARRLALAK